MALILGSSEYCLKLANYLRDYLNKSYAEQVLVNTELPSSIVVRSIRNYDDPHVPLSEFPLLKVYRNQDQFDRNGLSRNVNATITYSVSYPNLDELPDLLYWASYVINKALVQFNYEHQLLELPSPNISQYMLTVNEVTQAVYPFLRFQIRFLDQCMNFNQY